MVRQALGWVTSSRTPGVLREYAQGHDTQFGNCVIKTEEQSYALKPGPSIDIIQYVGRDQSLNSMDPLISSCVTGEK